jgi:hypothetical protein
MKIELTSFKFFPSLSQETNCFQANLVINGVKAGVVENRGEGGPSFYQPLNPAGAALIREAEVWAKAQPPRHFEGMDLPMSLEFHIDLLVEELVQKAEVAKAIKSFEKRFEKAIILVNEEQYKKFKLGEAVNLSYRELKFKGKTIAQIPANILKDQVAKIKLLPGEIIANTNIQK